MSEASRDQNHVPTMLGVSSVDGVTPIPVEIDPVTGRLLVDSTGGAGYTNLTQFVSQTPWRVFYSDGSGDVQELALGANGEVLTSQGAAAVPTWTAAGAGDMTLAGVQTVTGAKTFGTIGGAVGKLILAGSTSGSSILNAAATAGSTTITLPGTTTVLAGLSVANSFTTAQAITPTTDVISLAVRRNGAAQTANILEIQTEANGFLAGFDKSGILTLPVSGLTLGAVNVTTTGTKLNYLTSATGTTGTASTNIVFSTSPVLTTPTLGVASATSINKVAFTAPATGSTLTILDGKTLTVNKSITLEGTDSTTMTFPATSKTIAANDGSNMTLTSQATGDLITAASASTLGRLADVAVGQVLISGGVGVAPSYSANPSVTTLEVGAGSTDTTLSRLGAGVFGIEGEAVSGWATTATAAGTTTLAITDKIVQVFTGTTTQTVKLPTTSVVAGQVYTIINQCTTTAGVVTVQSSGANEILILSYGAWAQFRATQATPTTAAHWTFIRSPRNSYTNTSLTTDTGTTLNCDYYSDYFLTAQTGAILLNAPSGTPRDGQTLMVSIASSTTATRSITYNAIFEASTVALVTTTTATTTPVYLGFKYNAARVKWVNLATA